MRNRVSSLLLAAVVLLTVSCWLGSAAEDAADAVQVERIISTAHALPGSTFRVVVRIRAKEDLIGVGLREIIPLGWTLHPIEGEGSAFKRTENEWIFPAGVEANSTTVVIYELTVPPADRLYVGSLPACFDISGVFQATLNGIEAPVEGDTTVEIVSALPIPTAVAHLVPGSAPGDVRVDLRLDRTIEREQLEWALAFWATDTPVPWTGGEVIELAMAEHLVALHEACIKADEALPKSVDPELVAIRSIDTALPCDSILLSEDCPDPGLEARLFDVIVTVSGGHDAYGIGLAEWFPETWIVSSREQGDIIYRPSRNEWIYPAKLKAGERLEIRYTVEVVASTTDLLDTVPGCCGSEKTLVGRASSGLECSESQVAGETSVYLWNCLPVLLAISRWDVEDDRLDASLSDAITFPQVQRAVDFWLSGTPVPHTCGYTVGYHMLKTIVGYWLAGAPITQPLPDSVADSCEESAQDCYTPICPQDGLCQLADLQSPDDYVGIPPSPRLSVDVDGVSELTCATPATTLRAEIQGGIPPYRVEWRGADGALLGTSEELRVAEPGVYSATIRSVGGCQVGQQVVITGDFEAPLVIVESQGSLGCEVREVALSANILGGRSPFMVQWFDGAGTLVGEDVTLIVERPGVYRVAVTGANGCVGVAETVVIEERQTPSAEGGPDRVLTCVLPEVMLEGSATGGMEPLVYEWTDGNGEILSVTPTVWIDEPGEYLLTVTGANGCLGSDLVRVEQDTEPPVLELTTSGALTCSGQAVALAVEVQGGRAPFEIDWTGPAGDSLASSDTVWVADPGQYVVTVTGANGCTAIGSIEVVEDLDAPAVQATVDGVLACATPMVPVRVDVSGGRPPFAILWSDPLGTVIGEGAELMVEEPGTYTVTVTGANGCSTDDVVEVSQDLAAPEVEASVSGLLTCATPTVGLRVDVVGGRAPYTITWTDESGSSIGASADISVSQAGTYSVSVAGTNGCVSTDTITVSQDVTAPTVEVSVSGELTCAVETVEIQATISGARAPFTIAWSDPSGAPIGDGTERLAVREAGTYTVTVVGGNGCVATASATVSQDLTAPVVRATVSGLLSCAVEQVELRAEIDDGRAPYVFSWIDPLGKKISDNVSAPATSPGTYQVTVTGANGCSSSQTVLVEEDLRTPQVVVLASDDLSCAVTTVDLRAQIHDGLEPYVISWKDASGVAIGNTETISVEQPGTYIVTVTGANGCASTSQVTVLEDMAEPRIETHVRGELTCKTDEVTLSVDVFEGRPPYAIAWTDATGLLIADGASAAVYRQGSYTVTVIGSNGCLATETVTVSENTTAPIVEVSASGALSCAVTAVDLQAEIRGGQEPYAVSWKDASGAAIGNTESITVEYPGTYIVTVTGANGCASTGQVTVLEDVTEPKIETHIGGELTCKTDEVTLSVDVFKGRPPYTIAWTDAAGLLIADAESVVIHEPGSYTVTVVGSNGCLASETVTVSEDIKAPVVEVSASDTLSCAVATVDLQAQIRDGREPYVISWKDAAGSAVGNTESITVEHPGTYIVTVTGANGCASTGQVTVLEDSAEPRIGVHVGGELTCKTNDVTLVADVSEGRAPYTMAWTDPSGFVISSASSVIVDEPGIYTVTVIGANGCLSSETATVVADLIPPVVEVSVSGVLTCLVQEVTLQAEVQSGTPPYVVVWQDPFGAPISNEHAVIVDGPGAYTVTVTGANGCSSSCEVTVAQDVAAPQLEAFVSGTLSCQTPSATLGVEVLGGRPPFEFVWSDCCSIEIGTGREIEVFGTGTYVVTVTGANGCQATAAVEVFEDLEPPVVQASVSGDLTCDEPSARLTAIADGGRPPYDLIWTDSEGQILGWGPTIDVSEPGTYTVIATGQNGCAAFTEVTVLENVVPPAFDLGEDRNLTCDEPEIVLSAAPWAGVAPFTYLWLDACETFLGTLPTLTVSVPGTYQVTVTGANGCSFSDSVTIGDGVNPPMVDLGPDRDMVCCGTEMILESTVTGGLPPYRYEWRDDCDTIIGSEAAVTISQPGSYLLIVRTADGCIGSDTIVIR